MKNTLSDLNDHLFAQLERLGDEDISKEKLAGEIKRSKAITTVAKEVISNAQTVLEGAKLRVEHGVGMRPGDLPAYLEHKPK